MEGGTKSSKSRGGVRAPAKDEVGHDGPLVTLETVRGLGASRELGKMSFSHLKLPPLMCLTLD